MTRKPFFSDVHNKVKGPVLVCFCVAVAQKLWKLGTLSTTTTTTPIPPATSASAYEALLIGKLNATHFPTGSCADFCSLQSVVFYVMYWTFVFFLYIYIYIYALSTVISSSYSTTSCFPTLPVINVILSSLFLLFFLLSILLACYNVSFAVAFCCVLVVVFIVCVGYFIF